MANPWDRPPFPAKGDSSEDITYAAIGRALNQWENFELDLAAIFSVLVGGGEESFEGSRAYGAVASFRGRIDLVDAAAEAYFTRCPAPPLHEKLTDLLNLAKHLSGRRNDIAHCVVLPYQVFDTTYTLTPVGFCLFTPTYSKKSRLFGVPSYIYSSEEINKFTVAFEALSGPANEIHAAIHTRHEPLPEKYRALLHQPI